MPFTHLHLHTEYSLLDGANRIKTLPARIKELGMDACAITDHGVMYGVVDFYLACKKEGIKPIIGCEVYVAENGRFNKQGAEARQLSHLILLAENKQGLQNLNRLVSAGFTEGFYYKPRIDLELLERWHEGLIALSACLNGAVARELRTGNHQEAQRKARLYQSIMGEGRYYLEIQANGLLDQRKVNRDLGAMSELLHIPLVATNDCHYERQQDARAHEILLCIQTGKRMSDPDRMRMGTDQLYVKSPEEMRRALPDFPEALANTEAIAARCQAELDFSTIHLPAYTAPNGETAKQYLCQLCRQGLDDRLQAQDKAAFLPTGMTGESSGGQAAAKSSGAEPDVGSSAVGEDSAAVLPPASKISAAEDVGGRRARYAERLEHELKIITQMGYEDYYLIVWDFIHFARTQNIMVGPGRGSGAGSLAAYTLGITNIDPMRYNLLFERFLNPERVSMPDFDTDFCYERRGEVIDYVTAKYGQERVAQVATFGTLAARACVRDVARALDFSYADADRLAKMVPGELGMTLEKALEQSSELKEAYEGEARTRELFDTARLLEGMPRHASTHAAGVVISSEPLTNLVPLSKNDESVVIQYAKSNIEKLGLLKFDFLGLRTLTVLRDTRDMVLANDGLLLDFDHLPMDDKGVFDMISSGDTAGVFQLESSGMTAFIRELRPESLEDIIAGVALFRPGPMVGIPRYVAARHDPRKIHYDHPLLEPILNVTYGCIVYQEQVMQIVRDLAGFSLGQADIVRRAMSKKDPVMLGEYRDLFIHGGVTEKGRAVDGAVKRGVPENIADRIFNDVLAFAGYAFNKSHAAAYAVVAYQTAWLKYHYPTEFMAAMLNSFMGNLAQAASYTHAAKNMGIRILPPDINASSVRFTTEGPKTIRFALGAVKNVGVAVIEDLVSEREKSGKYTSVGDFLRRMQKIRMNKKAVESLIKASALDSFGIPRNQLLAVFEYYMTQIAQSRQSVMEGQISFFDLGLVSDETTEPEYPVLPELDEMLKLQMEQEVLGLYVSGHPLDGFRDFLNSFRQRKVSLFSSEGLRPEKTEDGLQVSSANEAETAQLEQFNAGINNRRVLMCGLILHRSDKTAKRGGAFCVLTLEDLNSRYEALVFEQALAGCSNLLTPGAVLLFTGQIMARGDEEAKLVVRSAALCDEAGLKKLSDELRGQGGAASSPFAVDLYKSDNPAYPHDANKPEDRLTASAPSHGQSGSGTDVWLSEVRNAQIKQGPDAARKISLEITYNGAVSDTGYRMLTAMLAYFHGATPVRLRFLGEREGRYLPQACWVNLDGELLAVLAKRYGESALRFLPLPDETKF